MYTQDQQSATHPSGSPRPESPAANNAPPDFPSSELSDTLREQAFGISNYEIIHSTLHEAAARVLLLEGTAVVIVLSSRGYTVDKESGAQDTTMRSYAECVFESVEELLEMLSPRYTEARRDVLFAKLRALSC